MEIQQQVKTDSDGRTCWADNCHQRFAIDGGRGGYVIRGRTPDAGVAAAITAQYGAPGDGEHDVWVPAPVIERQADAH